MQLVFKNLGLMLLEARIYEQGVLEISQLQRRARFRVFHVYVGLDGGFRDSDPELW